MSSMTGGNVGLVSDFKVKTNEAKQKQKNRTKKEVNQDECRLTPDALPLVWHGLFPCVVFAFILCGTNQPSSVT